MNSHAPEYHRATTLQHPGLQERHNLKFFARNTRNTKDNQIKKQACFPLATSFNPVDDFTILTKPRNYPERGNTESGCSALMNARTRAPTGRICV